MSMRVLVTGFGPFPGAPRNPSAQIAAAIDARRLARLGIALDRMVLPVVYEAIAPLLADCRADVVLHIGLASRRRHVSIETRAVNRLSLLAPDAARRRATRMAITPGGPASLAANAPVAQIAAMFRRRGATQLSNDAGAYICNQTLYLSLARRGARVGFIHVPRLEHAQRIARLAADVTAAIILCAAQARRAAL